MEMCLTIKIQPGHGNQFLKKQGHEIRIRTSGYQVKNLDTPLFKEPRNTAVFWMFLLDVKKNPTIRE